MDSGGVAAGYDEMGGRLGGLVDMSICVGYSSADATYESLCSCEPDSFEVHACD